MYYDVECNIENCYNNATRFKSTSKPYLLHSSKIQQIGSIRQCNGSYTDVVGTSKQWDAREEINVEGAHSRKL